MQNLLFWMVALAALSGDALLAQDLTGTWQGTVIKISKVDGSALRGILYSIDPGGQGIPANPVTLQGPA
jgi:hypothetical protein